MNFKDFCKTDESRKEKKDEKMYKENNADKKSVEDKLNKYSKLSSEELMTEFIKESQSVKDKGGYNSDQIEMMRNVLFPHLSEEQKRYFETLIGMVK